MITVGARAPAFSLQNENEETVRLSHFLGNWVVLYFIQKMTRLVVQPKPVNFHTNLRNSKN